MNKKLLFGIMSLAALAACTNDDFDSQQVAEGTSPIQFEVINNNASMRASMGGNTGDKVVWSAADGDLFTLYHGGTVTGLGSLTAYQNATYKAVAEDGKAATLTTPSMINQGYAIMTWPTDTVFRATGGALSIVIPQDQTDKIQNEIPYVSDLINIQTHAAYNEDATKGAVTAYNTAGKDRKYSVYMRPMASQLNLKAEYGTTENQIKELYEGETGVETGEGIDPIKVTSVELLTTPGAGGTTPFTTEIPLKFTTAASYTAVDPTNAPLPTVGITAMWNAADAHNAWSHVTCFDVAGIGAGGKVDKLTTKYLLADNKGCKFLILPQATIGGGVADPGVVVKTIYGKVVIANPALPNPHATKYTAAEYNNAWYRYLSTRKTVADAEENVSAATAETSGENAGKYKTVAKDLAMGMQQTINYMSTYGARSSLSAIQSEPIGVALTRYVNVNLAHLDMSDLHIKTDKQLRDAARVWKKMGLDDVTVYLDGNSSGEFEISQKTIKVINDINAAVAGKDFKVQPCNVPGEACSKIVITGGDAIQNLAFIKFNDTDDNGIYTAGTDVKADVIFKANENWKWNGTVKVATAATTGINQFINKGKMTNNETKVLAIYDDATPTVAQLFTIPLINDGEWNIENNATIRVQFDVTNNGTVNIAKGAQYRQDGTGNVFTNEATTLPKRITKAAAEQIGKVENKGVFATVASGVINNYGLIEHADPDAKTYVTANQTLATDGFTTNADFTTAFDKTTSGVGNKMGRINLPYSNKNEDNVSVSAALAQGFVSVTVDGEVTGALDARVVGSKVNYVIVKSGITEIQAVAEQVKYLEINQPGTELAWNVPTTTEYDGLIVLSDVNIKLGTKIIATTTYLGADMYVGGKFNQAAIAAETPDPAYPATNFNGYYGNTNGNVATKYITY